LFVQEPKQVIVVRKDLGMRKGKMIAQGAHASIAAILSRRWPELEAALSAKATVIESTAAMQEWFDGRFTKVAVGADSEEELIAIQDAAQAAGLPCSIIRDAGKTEFGGVPTLTACAVGPAYPDEIDPITGHLSLL
jgi:PTH2 family peptidyl-tRNA hydrolase